jgi:hypothetical protein
VASAEQFAGKLDFPTLVDTENRLAAMLGYRVIPNGYLFANDGALLDELVGDFDLRSPPTRTLLRGWLGEGPAPVRPRADPVDATSDGAALGLFAEGEALLGRGERRRALARWHKAYLAAPRSFVIRKQIWRALYPDRFGDPIDTAWQRGQIESEKEFGFGAANPALPAPE